MERRTFLKWSLRVGALAALEERHRTGRGQLVKSSLYETTVFLVGQHIAQQAVTGQAVRPMPSRVSACFKASRISW